MTATPTRSSPTGVTYASTMRPTCTSTRSVHGVDRVVRPQTPAADPRPRLHQAEPAAQWTPHPVGHDHIPGAQSVGLHPVRSLLQGLDPDRLETHAGGRSRLVQRPGQFQPADPAAGPVGETRGNGPPVVQVADASERAPRQLRHPQRGELAQGGRHQTLSAGLVDRRAAVLSHDDLQPRSGSGQGRGHPDRSAPGHQDVDHTAAASARSSVLMRTASSGTLRAVKTTAVIHAVCTSGRAAPSTTTAT